MKKWQQEAQAAAVALEAQALKDETNAVIELETITVPGLEDDLRSLEAAATAETANAICDTDFNELIERANTTLGTIMSGNDLMQTNVAAELSRLEEEKTVARNNRALEQQRLEQQRLMVQLATLPAAVQQAVAQTALNPAVSANQTVTSFDADGDFI